MTCPRKLAWYGVTFVGAAPRREILGAFGAP